MLPSYCEDVKASLFSQWVVFGSLQCYMPSPQVQGHKLIYWPSKFTSKAQEVLSVENDYVENATSLVGESFALRGHWKLK